MCYGGRGRPVRARCQYLVRPDGAGRNAKDIQDTIARALNAALKSEALRSQLEKMGYEPLGGSPADFTRYIDAELKKWTEPPRWQA